MASAPARLARLGLTRVTDNLAEAGELAIAAAFVRLFRPELQRRFLRPRGAAEEEPCAGAPGAGSSPCR